MNRLFAEILAGKLSTTELMQRVAEMTKFELDSAAAHLGEGQIVALSVKMSDQLRVIQVESMICAGCYLYLYRIVIDNVGDEQREQNFWEAAEVSRAQAYRAIAVWCAFGKTFVAEGHLTKQFVSESLKILAGETTPPAARDEALQLARNGQHISIQVAKQLQKKHAAGRASAGKSTIVTKETSTPVAKPEAKQDRPLKANAAKAIWSYVGSVVRLIVQPAKTSSQADIEGIIRDLEAALARFRSEHQIPTASKSPDAA